MNLLPGKSFFLRTTYAGKGDGKPSDDIGRWQLLGDGATLILRGGKESSERFAVKSSDILRKLDLQGREIDSKRNYDLRRTAAFERIEPRLGMRGMSATFTECQTGQRWPVSMKGGYKALEQRMRRPGGNLEKNSSSMSKVKLQLGLTRMVAAQPLPSSLSASSASGREKHAVPFATTQLQETYWKLTRLGDKPVIFAEKQREPSLIFRSEQSRVTGYGGCNNLTGAYKLSGDALTLSGIVATRRACLQGMDVEGALLKAVDRIRTWKISGRHLELYDAGGNMLARLEARALN